MLGLLELLLDEYVGLQVINAIREVIHAYGAQCTLDSFSFNAKGGLQYRCRLAARMRPSVMHAASHRISETGISQKSSLHLCVVSSVQALTCFWRHF